MMYHALLFRILPDSKRNSEHDPKRNDTYEPIMFRVIPIPARLSADLECDSSESNNYDMESELWW